MSNINFSAGGNFAEGRAILNPVIQEIINTTDSQVGMADQAAVLGFTIGDVVTPDGEITAMVGPEPLKPLAENGVAALATVIQGYTKKYELSGWALKYSCSKLFSKWIEKGAVLAGADSSVLAELNKFKEETERLIYGAQLTRNILMTKVFAEGFAGTTTSPAYGPGSLMGDGQLLFSASHVIKKTGGTFSNLLGSALSAASLEAAIQSYKTTIYAPNGYRIKTPDVFTLMVPRALEITARKILNSNGDQAGIYAGTLNNANLLNVFSFQGSKVKLVVLDMLGEMDESLNKIGGANADAMWFLANNEYNLKYKSFRIFTLWANEMDMWRDDETKQINTSLDSWYGVDAYNAEWIMGYPGA